MSLWSCQGCDKEFSDGILGLPVELSSPVDHYRSRAGSGANVLLFATNIQRESLGCGMDMARSRFQIERRILYIIIRELDFVIFRRSQSSGIEICRVFVTTQRNFAIAFYDSSHWPGQIAPGPPRLRLIKSCTNLFLLSLHIASCSKERNFVQNDCN